ncbi:MAG: hypothetical protein ACOX3T_07970 [Bdellovibrionota bacterium]
MIFKKRNFLLLFLILCVSCVNHDLQSALDADKKGDTTTALKHFNKYLNSKSNKETIDTANVRVNTLQAKKLVKKIETTLEAQEDTLTADDYRKMLKEIRSHKNWDPDDIIFSLTKSRIKDRLAIIQDECKSLETVLNVFLKNKEEIKAYKTFNFIKEKDRNYKVAPLTEIKIVDIFTKHNEKNFYKNVKNNNFKDAALFLQVLDAELFSEIYKEELRKKYSNVLSQIATPKIAKLIEEKKFLNAYDINNTTIKNEAIKEKIKEELKENLINQDGTVSVKDFITLEGYLIISPELKPLVEKSYYEYIDKISLPITNISFVLKNYGLRKDIYNDLKFSIKSKISEMTIPIKLKNSKSKDLDYSIELETYKIENDKIKTKINISKIKPKHENIVIQKISSIYNENLKVVSTSRLTNKIMKVIRQNVKIDVLTMLKSARYYLARKDLKNFKDITSKLILLNQIEPFDDDTENKLINLLSEYEAL